MRPLFMTVLVLGIVLCALSLAADEPVKSPSSTVPPPPDPAVIRQGGDTIETAIVIPEYGQFTGQTTGFTDDYDEVCPYDGSTSPDVVYQFTPASDECYQFDLNGSAYDTKIYIYDEARNLVACNDDYHPDYTSLLMTNMMVPGETYFVVIDGYGGSHGDYILHLFYYLPYTVYCSSEFVDDGEPPLEDDVPDTYNSGCDGSSTDPAIIPLLGDASGHLPLCGSLGWITIDDEVVMDIDWYSLTVGATGAIDCLARIARPTHFTVMRPGGCDGIEVIQTTSFSIPGQDEPFQILGEPGEELWLRVAMDPSPPPCGGETPQDQTYRLSMDGLQGTVAVEGMSLSSVKSLYR